MLKDSIPLITPSFYFSTEQCDNPANLIKATRCPGDQKFKYYVKLQQVSPKKMKYRLYYSNACEAKNQDPQYLLQVGTIKLRKARNNTLAH